MTRIPPFSSQHLEAACRVLADTERGLSGTQIERLLQEIEIADTSPGMTKWKRLFNALAGAHVIRKDKALELDTTVVLEMNRRNRHRRHAPALSRGCCS